jgi:hypothetical protein
MTTTVQESLTNEEARKNLKLQLAKYLAGQPESICATHRWMKRVDLAGVGIVITAFAVALYGSFTWAKVNPSMIPVAWFFFATCCSLMVVLFGLHAILIRAYPPVILPGKAQRFVSGSGALWVGAASIAGGLIAAGLWIAFAYATATFNLAMIVPLTNVMGVVVGIGILVSIVFALYQKASGSR